MKIDLILPTKIENDWKDYLKSIVSNSLLEIFEPIILDFIKELSSFILKDKSLRTYKELVAMAYWLRQKHILEIKNEFEKQTIGLYFKPRGVVLHFAPSNVDTIFVYSWLISMLMGNINILRVSQKNSEQFKILMNIINKILDKDKFLEIKKRTFIISYEHDDLITQELSSVCDLRVIWGGDETIKKIRSIPIPPNANELVFPDKFSISAFQSESINNLNDNEFNNLISSFYNDAYYFDQMACSSPKLIIWIGESKEIVKAKSKFWEKLELFVNQKNLQFDDSLEMTKMVTTFYYASNDNVKDITFDNKTNIHRIDIKNIDNSIKNAHCGGGLFLEAQRDSLLSILDLLDKKDQTLSIFGFSEDDIKSLFYSLKNKTIDRIVPIGQSLNFNNIWDGYNLPIYFSRQISIIYK